MRAPFLSVNFKDFLRGLFLAVISSVIAIVYKSIESGNLTFDLDAIGMAALSAALAYITKNFLSNSNGELLKSEDDSKTV